MLHDPDLAARLADAQADAASLELQQRVTDRLAIFAVALVCAAIAVPALVAAIRSAL